MKERYINQNTSGHIWPSHDQEGWTLTEYEYTEPVYNHRGLIATRDCALFTYSHKTHGIMNVRRYS